MSFSEKVAFSVRWVCVDFGVGGDCVDKRFRLTRCRHYEGNFDYPCNYALVEGDRAFCGVDGKECKVVLD